MTAWLVINEFLNQSKFRELTKWFVDAAKQREIDLIVKTNAEILPCLGKKELLVKGEKPFFVLFWDKDILLARALENRGLRLFNSAKAIEICDNKGLTHLELEQGRIPMPDTVIAPLTYSGIGYTNYHFLSKVMEMIPFPMVVKESFGSFGQQVYLAKSEEELRAKVEQIGCRPMIFQKYIQSSFGRDVRLQVVGDKVIASMYRFSENGDFRANVSNGGSMKEYIPTMEQEKLAISCCEMIGLDFAGVDLLFDEEEKPIVCEVNSNAHFKNLYDCTNVNTAEAIVSYICQKCKIQ